MSRRPIIAGNWKMNLTVAEGLALASEVQRRVTRLRDVDVVIAPPALAVHPIAKRLDDGSVKVATQNCHWAAKGAYTGELSPAQCLEAGATYVIIGHSERRALFGETDEGVSRKARSLHDHGLIPIICCGETLEQREAEETFEVVTRQVSAALAALSGDEVSRSVVAYEPVWAIGTGRTATPAQAQEVHAVIRKAIAERCGDEVAQAVRIQYGGSVKPDNIVGLMQQDDIDGALVGGASLVADSFVKICGFREENL